MCSRSALSSWIAMLWLGLGVVRAAPLLLGNIPGLDPSQLRITTFTTGVSFPTAIVSGPAGGMLIGGMVPGQEFSAWHVQRFVDADGNGVADGPGVTLMGGAGVYVTGLASTGNLTAVAILDGPTSTIRLFAPGAAPSDPYTPLGTITVGFGASLHPTIGLAMRPAAGQPGSYELFFSLGAGDNNLVGPDLAVSGVINGNLAASSIYRVTLTPGGGGVTAGAVTRVASGIRNTIGMGFHPTTGDFYFADNGIDGLVDVNESFSADELNMVTNAQLAATVDFGFPAGYVTYRSGVVVGGGTQPIHVFQPLGDPNTGSESEGATNIAFSPASFPDALLNGVFVGFSGENGSGLANGENPVVYLDLQTGTHYHFISNDDPNVGHIVGLASTGNSLFLADLYGTNGGAVYQVAFVPEPSAWVLMGLGLAMVGRLRARARG